MMRLLAVVGSWVLLLSGCGSPPVMLIPTPAAYQDDRVAQLYRITEEDKTTRTDVLYATTRRPTGDADKRRYGKAAGDALSIGQSTLRFGDGDLTWQQLHDLSFQDTRKKKIPVRLLAVDEFGTLPGTIVGLTGRPPAADHTATHSAADSDAAAERFADAINRALADSPRKEVTIYIHGAIVDFYHPLAVAAGFHHYRGRQGAMIAFAWRTHPGILSYAGDVQRAKEADQSLAMLIDFVAHRTDAQEIDLVSYSAGGPLMARALIRLRERDPQLDHPRLLEKYKIGAAVFASSDIDLRTFTEDMLPRLYDVAREVVVTVNRNDGSLALAQMLYGASRLGKPAVRELSEEELEGIARMMDERLTVIDVTEAISLRGKGDARGHGYWYRNDWVCTEILAAIAWHLPPDQRGLERRAGKKAYFFPPDYPTRVADQILAKHAAQSPSPH